MRKVSTASNLQVLYEDNHIIAINKRVGDLVQGDKTGDTPLNEVVKNFLVIKYNKPGEAYLGTIHRLDRPTSGVVLFAKTSKALSRLNLQFKNKEVQKIYWAITTKTKIKSENTLTHWLIKNQRTNTSKAFLKESTQSKKAVLHYKRIKLFDNFQLLEVILETGRHHQIRVQLAQIDSPIKGDLKYGSKRSNKDGGICLHAKKITFTHPVTKQKMIIQAPLPKNDIWKNC